MLSVGWQHNYSSKTRQAGHANEQSTYSPMSMVKGNFDIVYNFQSALFHCDWGYANIIKKFYYICPRGNKAQNAEHFNCSAMVLFSDPGS
jgi:hypothetical protein